MLSLFATLPSDVVRKLHPFIQKTNSLPRANISDIDQSIVNKQTQSIFYQLIKMFFSFIWDEHPQTTELDGGLYIGLGLNLTALSPNATQALFYELDPARDWDFNSIGKHQWPVPGLTAGEIDTLTLLSLTGVNNPNGSFVGYLPMLNASLNSFANTRLSVGQQLGLLATIYDNNQNIGPTLKIALRDMLKFQRDILPMQIIVEYSNQNFQISKQNRLLSYAAMFHGNITHPELDVHLTHRIAQRLLANNENVTIINGPVRWGIPTGDFGNDFRGLNKIQIIPSVNPNKSEYEPTILGTPNADNLTLVVDTQTASPIFYGGDGDDILNFQSLETSELGKNFPFFAGGMGFDRINISYVGNSYPPDTQTAVQDPDNGQISITNKFSCSFGGFLIENPFHLCYQKFSTMIQKEDDGSQSFLLNSNDFNYTIFDFYPGKFQFYPGGFKYNISNRTDCGGIVNSQNFIILPPSLRHSNYTLFNLTDGSNETFALPTPANWDGGYGLFSSREGDIYVIGGFSNYAHVNISFGTLDLKTKKINATTIDSAFSMYPTSVFFNGQLLQLQGGDIAFVYIYQNSISSNYTIKLSVNGRQPINVYQLDQSAGYPMFSEVWPINNDEMIMSFQYTDGQYLNNRLMYFNKKGLITALVPIDNNKLGMAAPLSMSDGYLFSLYDPLTFKGVDRMYRDGGWLPDSAPIFLGASNNLLLEQPHDLTLSLSRRDDHFIIDENNSVLAGPFGWSFDNFGFSGTDVSWIDAAKLQDGNTLLLACSLESYIQAIVVLPTALLQQSNTSKNAYTKRPDNYAKFFASHQMSTTHNDTVQPLLTIAAAKNAPSNFANVNMISPLLILINFILLLWQFNSQKCRNDNETYRNIRP